MDHKYLKNYPAIIGFDEVGRGPIAGPVCACAVRVNDSKFIDLLKTFNVTDSKKLTTKKREIILEQLNIDTSQLSLNKVYQQSIQGMNLTFVLSEVDHKEIDKINILQASLLAMKNCAELIYLPGDYMLIDGNKNFSEIKESEAIVKGDSKVVAIALASIIAKNFRDEKMQAYALEYPGYFFENHAGYPTKVHKEAVVNLDHHRFTEEHLKASKNISKGLMLEQQNSLKLHNEMIAVLISSQFLRKLGCGQVDLVVFNQGELVVFEIKNSPLMVSRRQINRLNRSCDLLSKIFNVSCQLCVIKSLPKDLSQLNLNI